MTNFNINSIILGDKKYDREFYFIKYINNIHCSCSFFYTCTDCDESFEQKTRLNKLELCNLQNILKSYHDKNCILRIGH